MGNYTAQIKREGDKVIFDFPSLLDDEISIEQAFLYAQDWIRDHDDKVEEHCSYFIKLKDKYFKFQ